MKIQVEMNGYEEERVQAWLFDKVAAHFALQLDGQIKKAVDDMLKQMTDDAIQRVVDDRVTAAIDEVIAQGWQRMSPYGEPIGPKESLQVRVAKLLFEPSGDRYNSSNRTTRVEQLAKEAIDAALGKELGQELTRAKEQIRAQVDAVVQAKLSKTLKDALGL